ncbi:hypothetical protein E1B28_009180 [Marasmius oreades]|uniref:Uncharacterized protein n=1 Tax=Marasmius oreades TaxID=181124 RepID=A0A9P7USW7_9AGAR|nr:uncharacterized protein E1B28_009180 [Marasmius oreades]KAG7092868.1 hypothetical protein E1B28_009180 [Marasmius oreades]
MSFSFSLPLTPSASTSNTSTSSSLLTTVKQNEEHFVCIPIALQSGPGQKSFEEVRADDYLKALSTTGRAPQPCPQEPKLPAERAALGLPKLFEPTSISKSSNVGDLPEWQTFSSPLSSPEGTLYSITALNDYSAFSFEELRYHTYRKGKINPPNTIKLEPFTPPTPVHPSTTPSTTLISNGIEYGGDTKETFLSISSKPEFALHSFEELRCAYAQARREVTSSEILGASGASVPPPAPVTSSSTFPPPPPPVAGATSVPTFSFGFER